MKHVSTTQLVLWGIAGLLACVPVPISHAEAQTNRQMTLPILTYHYVEIVQNKTDRHRGALAIAPAVFEKQLKALKDRGYEAIFVREIPRLLSISAPSSILNPQYTNPHPSSLLAPARSFAEIIQPANSLPGSKAGCHGVVPQVRDGDEQSLRSIALTFDDGYEDFFTDAFPLLKEYDMKATLYVVLDFIGRPGYLSAAELKDIIASGRVEIGAHTVHHKNLIALSRAVAKEEIEGSKRSLEQDYGVTVETFAYPYGKHTPKVEALVGQAGFSAAVTTDRGFLQSSDRLLTLKRIPAGTFLGSRKWRVIGG